jgi:cytochrome c oxidase assembly factor CtaG
LRADSFTIAKSFRDGLTATAAFHNLAGSARRRQGEIVSEQTHTVLRLQQHVVPALRAEFDSAIAQISTALVDLRSRGYLAAAWLGDETSAEVADHYTRRTFDEPDSSYSALVGYLAELTHVRDTLQRMEDQYRSTDRDTADRYRRI